MKPSRLIIGLGCVMALCLTVYGQQRPVATAASDVPAPTTPTTGKFDVTFNIIIRSSWIPTSDTIGVEVTANVAGEGSTFHESAAIACPRSGNTATCVVSFYYSWLLAHPSEDTINLTYEVAAPPEGTGQISVPYRESTSTASITPVPASGAVTRLAVDFTL
jgi:hypothetical protein